MSYADDLLEPERTKILRGVQEIPSHVRARRAKRFELIWKQIEKESPTRARKPPKAMHL